MAADSENVFHSLKLLFVCFIYAFIIDTCINYLLSANDSKLNVFRQLPKMDKFIVKIAKRRK